MSNSVGKRILIVSNNALSQTNNNGKTIESIFKNSKDSLAQLFLRAEIPNSNICEKFYRITEQDLINKMLIRNKCSGLKVLNQLENVDYNSSITDGNSIKKIASIRLLREILWKNDRWKDKAFDQWLDEIKPEIIFFCAGDALFSYAIVEYIKSKYNCKLVLYITDDYILRKYFSSKMDKYRLKLVHSKMVPFIKNCDLLITISDKMKSEYKRCFDKESIVVRNMTGSLKDKSQHVENQNCLNFIYAGSLYYGRDHVLFEFAKYLNKYNSLHKTEHKVMLYTNAQLNKSGQNKIVDLKCIHYGGSLTPDELKCALNKSDIPVFVESFEQKYIEKTKYSFSTKIPEYLSLGKCILAIGPKDIGSMEYLANTAWCLNDLEKLEDVIRSLCNNIELRTQVGEACIKKYNEYIKEVKQTKVLDEILNC